MGAGIAEVCARAGREVVVVESDVMAADSARSRIDASLDKARNGELDQTEAEQAARRIRVSVDFSDMADRDMVIEAIAATNEQRSRCSQCSTRSW